MVIYNQVTLICKQFNVLNSKYSSFVCNELSLSSVIILDSRENGDTILLFCTQSCARIWPQNICYVGDTHISIITGLPACPPIISSSALSRTCLIHLSRQGVMGAKHLVQGCEQQVRSNQGPLVFEVSTYTLVLPYPESAWIRQISNSCHIDR